MTLTGVTVVLKQLGKQESCITISIIKIQRVLATILTSSVKDSRHLLMVVILTLKSDSQGVTKTLMNRTINTNKKSLKIPEG
jgi:hypothetical protein